MNTRNLKTRKSNKYLFKGEPKSRKSCSAASFPNSYIIDLDKRIRSIAAFHRNHDFDYDWFDSFTPLDEKLDMLLRRCDYDTIVFDGCTTFAEMIINTMIKSRPLNPKTTRAGVRMTEIEDFGGEQRAFDIVFDKLFAIHQKFDVNIIVTAHVIEVEKAIRPGYTIKTRSLLTAGKKVAAFLPVRFDEVYHFQVNVPLEEGGFPRSEAFTQHSGDDWACTTYNIPPVLDFTNKSFYDVLMKAREEANNDEGTSTIEPGSIEVGFELESTRRDESTRIEGLEISNQDAGKESESSKITFDDSKELKSF